jgi:hypothetical protein
MKRYGPYIARLGLVFIVALVFTALFNEVTYGQQRESYDRPPQTVTLMIPPGTAQRVAAGERQPEIPEELIFVVGDTLEVINQDTVPHQLGPVWVPAGATGYLNMEKPDRVSYSCSFQNTRYLGIDVRQGTTMGIRLTALVLAAPTLTALLFMYSLVAFPVKAKISNVA